MALVSQGIHSAFPMINSRFIQNPSINGVLHAPCTSLSS
jgi:hypothetical protein